MSINDKQIDKCPNCNKEECICFRCPNCKLIKVEPGKTIKSEHISYYCKCKRDYTHKTGRPPLYSEPDALKRKIDEYFNKYEKYTKAGLTLFLGFNAHSQLDEYEMKNEFAEIIKRAKLRLEDYYERGLQRNACTGSLFWLKCNAEYNDKLLLEHKGELKVNIE